MELGLGGERKLVWGLGQGGEEEGMKGGERGLALFSGEVVIVLGGRVIE